MYSKRYGNREEVFNGIARQTTGGLIKEDLQEKKIGGKIHYISIKLSNAMKEKDNLSHFRERKKTIRSNTINKFINKGNSHTSKTKKIKFTDNPKIKKYYYPELEGENLEQLRANYLEEEEEDFNGTNNSDNSQDINFNIKNLDNDLNDFFAKI